MSIELRKDLLKIVAGAGCLAALLASSGRVARAAEAAPAGSTTWEVVSRLRAFKPEDSTQVPPAVAGDLTALKHALRDRIVRVAETPGSARTSPRDLTARVIAQLASEDVPVGDTSDGYGAISQIVMWQPPEYHAWLLATTTLSVPYGDDTSVYVFERNGGTWRYVLAAEATGYTKLAGAQGSLRVEVSPPGAAGEPPYLLLTNITPWPTSVWQTLRIEALRAGKSPQSPRVLVRRAESCNINEDYSMSVGPSGFEVIWLAGAVDSDLAGYRGVRYLRYAVTAGGAAPVSDIAFDPIRLVQSWTARPWTAASRLAAPAARTAARPWHRRLRRQNGEDAEWACGLDALRVGKGDRGELQVEAGCKQGDEEEPEVYLILTPTTRAFRIAAVSTTPVLPEPISRTIYEASTPGLIDAVPLCTIRPKLPPRVTAVTGFLARVLVIEDGTVESVELLRWPPRPGLAVPAVEALRRWQWQPARMEGQPVSMSLVVQVEFQ